jgi:hypothetical protein
MQSPGPDRFLRYRLLSPLLLMQGTLRLHRLERGRAAAPAQRPLRQLRLGRRGHR